MLDLLSCSRVENSSYNSYVLTVNLGTKALHHYAEISAYQ